MAGVRPIAVENLKQAGRVLRCIFIKTNGVQCGSPALKNCAYCFAHGRMAMRHPSRLDIPILEDANSVQVAIMEVIRGLLDGDIDRKTGGLVLYGLQMASANLKYVSFEPKDRGAVIRNIDDVVRYCDVEDVESDTGADQAADDTARANDGIHEQERATVSDLESAAQTEASAPGDDSQPRTVVAGDVEPARASFVEHSFVDQSSVDQSSTESAFDPNSPAALKQLEKLREELRAKSGKGPLPSAQEVQDAGIKSTEDMLDAMAEMHRLATDIANAERRIGTSVR
ncbi:MAG TPA: hypothetical protein VJ723_09020 [Candidatus Angelobacter sp.]|nr:hypothetical protein [Candidatus Angelobacter sp.]